MFALKLVDATAWGKVQWKQDVRGPDRRGSTLVRIIIAMTVRLYTMDTLEYAGCIISDGPRWHYRDVSDEHLMAMTEGMPLKAVLAYLSSFNLVYDLVE